MSEFVESLRRLYIAGEITMEKVFELEGDGKIDMEDVNFILEGEVFE